MVITYGAKIYENLFHSNFFNLKCHANESIPISTQPKSVHAKIFNVVMHTYDDTITYGPHTTIIPRRESTFQFSECCYI